MSEVTKRSISALDQCRDFLTAIFDAGDVIEFRPLPPTAGRRWATTAELPAIVDWLLPVNARKSHCYFGANPRTKAGESKEAGVALARCLYADFDGGVTVEEAWSRIKAAGMPTPTATVTTGGGVHCWWRLDQPVADHKLHGRLLKAIATTLPSDEAGTSGWPRIMRLPGFVNWKYEHEPSAELVDLDASRVYSLTELTPVKKAMSGSARAFIQHGSVAAGAGRRETMFAVACDLRDHGWTPEEAEAAIMPRMEQFGLSDDALADCPRQIRNAWKREPREVSAPAFGTPAAVATSSTRPKVDAYAPFPVDALPEPLKAFVEEASAAIGVDPAYIGVPLLPIVGAAIGTTLRLELRDDGYSVPAIVWAAIVGSSGSGKSPALRATLAASREHDRELRQEAAEIRREHEAEVDLYEAAAAAWRKQHASGKSTEPPPERPEPPRGRRALVVDATTEALAERLADNGRGLLLARDELSGWLGSLNRYSRSGASADEAFFLSAYDGESHSIDRRTGDRREIDVPLAALWIVGGIQAGVLQRGLTAERREAGLLARFLLTSPPARAAEWTEAEVSFATRQAYAELIAGLYRHEHEIDDQGREKPRLLRLDADAKKAYVAFFNRTSAELFELPEGDLKAALSKLRETAARIALILHAAKAEAERRVDLNVVDADSMSRAIRLAEWLRVETRRSYRLLGQTSEERAEQSADDKLLSWIDRQGGTVTARDVVTGCRWIETADDAEAALRRLVDARRGRLEDRPPGEKGGRPTRHFVLDRQAATSTPEAASRPVVSAQLHETRSKQGFANADSADGPRTTGGVIEL